MSQRLFFGDTRASLDYGAALARLSRLGYSITEIDIEPFYETARLLYEGPWVAERYLAARRIIETQPDALHPVTREIIAGGAKPRATEAFEAFYRLEVLRRVAGEIFSQVDALALPTAPTVYTCEQVLADPIRLNTRLGTYTNFVNLLDLCGVAVPAGCMPTIRRSASLSLHPPATTLLSRRSRVNSTPIPDCRPARPAPDTRRKRLRTELCRFTVDRASCQKFGLRACNLSTPPAMPAKSPISSAGTVLAVYSHKQPGSVS